jgi:hypothetical protein
VSERDPEVPTTIRGVIENAVATGMFTWEEIRGMPLAECLVACLLKEIEREHAASKALADQAETATCPFCGAEPGKSCVTVRSRYPGGRLPLWKFHAARLAAAMDADTRALMEGEQQ